MTGKRLKPMKPSDFARMGAEAMREKIARALAMSPRKAIYECAEHVRHNIKPPSFEEVVRHAGRVK